MCVILLVEHKALLDTKIVHQCWEQNNHGAGIMWFEDGAVRTDKGIMRLKDLLKAIKPLNGTTVFAIHMRWCTSGGLGRQLTHPFPLHDGAMMHNGTFASPPKYWGGSDSSYFAKTLEATTPPDLGHIDKYRAFLTENITGQRLLYFLPRQAHDKEEYGKHRFDFGQYFMSGDWETLEKGIKASNLRWRSSTTTQTLRDVAWVEEEYAVDEYLSLNLTEHTLSAEDGAEKARLLSEKIGAKVYTDELGLIPTHPKVSEALLQCQEHTGE